jgi:hypothetical protein
MGLLRGFRRTTKRNEAEMFCSVQVAGKAAKRKVSGLQGESSWQEKTGLTSRLYLLRSSPDPLTAVDRLDDALGLDGRRL